jgi:DNA-binding NtrC family response regulator
MENGKWTDFPLWEAEEKRSLVVEEGALKVSGLAFAEPKSDPVARPSLSLLNRKPMQQRRVAVVDDDEGIRLYLNEVLTQQGFEVFDFASAEPFLAKLEGSQSGGAGFVDVLLCDVRLPGIDGLAMVSQLKERSFDLPVILMTAFAEVQSAVKAMREGAYDYLEKPFDLSRLSSVLENALKFRELSFENRFLKNMIDSELKLQGVRCASPAMVAVYDLVKRVSLADSSVLITGESGVGKEVVARAIHENSPRAGKPFLSLNCSAIPESLLESELFGHTKGSFTGATHHRKGIFEEADGGTLFLDEIGDLQLSLQAKLLRVFQEQKIRAVGDNKFRSVNVRILTATHKNLVEEIGARHFREDLYYRLNVIPVHIPPLRQRREDIPILARYFLEQSARKNGSSVKGFTPAAMAKLSELRWSGNVRELQNVIERSVVLSRGELLDAADIPIETGADLEELMDGLSCDLPSLRDVEKRYIMSVLQRYQGKKDIAARALGMSRRTLYRKLEDREEGGENLR